MSTIKQHAAESKSLDYYQLILENTRDVIYLLEVTEDGRFIHIEINQAHVDVTGIPRDDVIGKYVDEFENESFKEILLRKYGSCLSAGIKTEFIGEYDFPGGLKIFHSILTPIRNDSGRITNIMGVARDITEKKHNDDRLRLYFERQLIGMAITSPLKGWIQSNEKLQQMMGYTHEELIQLTWDEMTHPDDLFKDMEQYQRLINAEIEDYMLEKRFIRKDGTIIYTKLSISCVRNIDQTIDYVLALIEDITEHKQQQALLAAKEQEFRALAEKTPDTIARYDLNCIRTYANPALYALTGLCTEEILGKKPTDYNYSVQAISYEEKLAEAMKTGFEADFEYSWPSKTGEMITSHIRIIPEKDANGAMCSALAIGRDITKLKAYESTLKQKETRLKQAQKVAKIGSLDVVFPGLKIDFSDETLRIFEIDSNVSSFSYDHLLDVVHPDDRVLVDQKLSEAIEKKAPYEIDHRLLFRDGRIKYVRQKWETIYDNKSNPVRSVGTVQDITTYKEQDLRLVENELNLREAQKIAKVGSWELEFPGLNLSWSDEIFRIFEIDRDNVQPSYDHFLNLIHPDDREQIDITFSQSLINKTPYDIVHRLLMSDGRIKYVHEQGYTIYDVHGDPLKTVGTVQDISERKIIEQKIEFLAHHDVLTQLPNRILAKHRAEHSIEFAKRHATKTALLFIDLDGFKTVNDFLGHSAGDTMLKIIASRLQLILRQSDTISRQGGDEFLFILSNIKEENDIITITEKILHELQKPFDIGLHTLSASASIGISIYPDHGDSFEQLLQNADTAMYKAKESGKNTYSFYTEEMNQSLIEQFQIQNDLKSALENNEFVLFYQPQIDLDNHRIIGAEALIRWQHPQLGMVPPMSFIPIAESSGHIIQIGQWVIEEACRQGALWHKQGIEITVAVNISAVQFKRGNLETVIKDALTYSGLNPQYLELELTETIMMHDAEMAIESVCSLKKLGVQISIDDFGTGYSSLGYLKRFSVDKLKIDQSFVRDILSDQDDAVIVNTIIQMAKNLNLKTIAEGVENADVLDIINSYGCDQVQGYHFAKPMEGTDFEKYHASFGKTQ